MLAQLFFLHPNIQSLSSGVLEQLLQLPLIDFESTTIAWRSMPNYRSQQATPINQFVIEEMMFYANTKLFFFF